jgi:hypothetical protein
MTKFLALVATTLIGFNVLGNTFEIKDTKTKDKLYIHEDEKGLEFEYCQSGQKCRALRKKLITRTELQTQANRLESQNKAKAIQVVAPFVFLKGETKKHGFKLGAIKPGSGDLDSRTYISGNELTVKKSVKEYVETLNRVLVDIEKRR